MAEHRVPRLLDRAGVRALLGNLAWTDVLNRIERGQLPGPIWGVAAADKAARWDRVAVGRALDAASRLPASIERDEAFLDRHLGI